MKIIEKHKQIIAWYQKKLGLSDYGLLWLVFFKGVFVALVIERLIDRFKEHPDFEGKGWNCKEAGLFHGKVV